MTKDVDNIKFKLKSAWKNEEFKSIKTLIQIPEEFKKHHLSKLEGFSTLYSRGLIY